MTHFDVLSSAVMGQFVHSSIQKKPCHTFESFGDPIGVADDCSFYVNESFPTLVLAFRLSYPFNYAEQYTVVGKQFFLNHLSIPCQFDPTHDRFFKWHFPHHI